MNNKTLNQFRYLLKFSGVFNILSAALLIFPFTYEHYLLFFNRINSALELGGRAVTLPANPMHSVLINTAGIDLVLIGAIVLAVSNKPFNNRSIILFNGLGRLLFATVITYYVIAENVIRIIIIFGLIDVIISFGFLYYLYKGKSHE